MMADQQDLCEDPRRWSVTRRARRLKLLSAVLLIGATFGLVPSVWILSMPDDPMLRPDIMHTPAVAGLAFCLALLFLGRRISHNAKARYGAALYGCIAHARKAGASQGMVFDIELPQVFPRVLFARQHRVMAVALPYPLLIQIDDVEMVTVTAGGFIRIGMKDDRAGMEFAGHGDPTHPLRDPVLGLPSATAIEYAAQAMALHGALAGEAAEALPGDDDPAGGVLRERCGGAAGGPVDPRRDPGRGGVA